MEFSWKKTLFVSLLAALSLIPIIAPRQLRADQAITVAAASSLTAALTEIGRLYESVYPGRMMLFSFSSSGAIYQQMRYGAPIDIFISANREFMDQAVREDLVLPESLVDLLTNDLVLAVHGAGGVPVATLEDLRQEAVRRIGIGNPATVPAGRYARQALVGAGQWKALVGKFIYANSARQVVDYLARGEVDAGFIYASDLFLAGGNRIKKAARVAGHDPIIYPLAIASSTGNRNRAEQFIRFLQSAKGKGILQAHGFSF